MTTSAAGQEAIYSSFGDDLELSELVELYVGEMPDRIAALEQALAAGDWEALRRNVHQMKGAAGSYGFDSLTQAAAEAETAIRQRRAIIEIQQLADELIGLCRRIRSGSGR